MVFSFPYLNESEHLENLTHSIVERQTRERKTSNAFEMNILSEDSFFMQRGVWVKKLVVSNFSWTILRFNLLVWLAEIRMFYVSNKTTGYAQAKRFRNFKLELQRGNFKVTMSLWTRENERLLVWWASLAPQSTSRQTGHQTGLLTFVYFENSKESGECR